ncbi:MAG: lytic transglycosylase domain-containing protein [Arenimonas sp.]
MLPGLELLECQNMAVSMDVMQHVVRVESSHNPYAIGVVGGHLVRQPKNLSEALATVRMLETRGYNFSLGLAQVNRYNLGKYGLDSYEKAFQECPNLQAGSRILAECYKRLGGDWGKSFSCYYSGNSVTGFRHGYVQKVFASMQKPDDQAVSKSFSTAIEVVAKPSRRVVGISRHPVYAVSAQPRLQQRIEAAATPTNLLATMPLLAAVQPNQITTPLPQQIAAVDSVPQQLVPTQLKAVETVKQETKPAVDNAFVF